MRYVKAKLSEYKQSLAYRIYVTDSLFYMADNMRLTKRFYEIIKPQQIDDRTGDQIASDVINRLGLKVENNG